METVVTYVGFDGCACAVFQKERAQRRRIHSSSQVQWCVTILHSVTYEGDERKTDLHKQAHRVLDIQRRIDKQQHACNLDGFTPRSNMERSFSFLLVNNRNLMCQPNDGQNQQQQTMFGMVTDARAATRLLTDATPPLSTATCNGVLPFCRGEAESDL